jgi:hypothetical protein
MVSCVEHATTTIHEDKYSLMFRILELFPAFSTCTACGWVDRYPPGRSRRGLCRERGGGAKLVAERRDSFFNTGRELFQMLLGLPSLAVNVSLNYETWPASSVIAPRIEISFGKKCVSNTSKRKYTWTLVCWILCSIKPIILNNVPRNTKPKIKTANIHYTEQSSSCAASSSKEEHKTLYSLHIGMVVK